MQRSILSILTTVFLILLTIFFLSENSQAQVAAWNFDGNAGDEISVNANSSSTNISLPVITRGGGIDPNSLANSFSSNQFSSDNITEAINNDEYIEFSITPNSGFSVSLSTLDANFRRSGTGPDTFRWQYSLDGFATAGINIGSEISYTEDGGDGHTQTQINLSGIHDLQEVENVITIRLYGWGASSTAGTFAIGRLSGNDLSIGGTVDLIPGSPVLSTDVNSLSGFEYTHGSGPSSVQTFELSGSNLDGSNVTLNSPTSFEISEDVNGPFLDEITLDEYDGTPTTIYVRLKDNLTADTYSENINISGGNAPSISVALSGEVLPPPPALSVGSSYTENFSAFQSLGTLPSGWDLDDNYTYRGAFSSSTTTSGVYGDGALGFQLTTSGVTSDFSATLTINNETGNNIEALSISYRGLVERLGVTRLPEWNVTVDGTNVNDLTYRTELGEDQEKLIIMSGLNIQQNEVFEIVWATSNDTDNTGSNRKIGFTDVKIEAIEFYADLTGSDGWRMLSVPTVNTSYADLLAPLWTQGVSEGANTDVGISNVLTYNGTGFDGINNLNVQIQDGTGFLIYVYDDVNYDGVDESFPKTIGINGTEIDSDITPTLNEGDGTLTLLGNPFYSTISWSGLNKDNMNEIVYVYDHSYGVIDGPPDVEATGVAGSYRAWNGSAGSLSGGLIAPFQGFWVQNAESGTPSITIPTSAKTTGGTLYKTGHEQPIVFSIRAQMDRKFSDAFFSFTDNGELGIDSFDAYKLTPLDHKNYLSISSLAEGTKLDINNLPREFSGSLSIPVKVNAYEAVKVGDTQGWDALGGEITLSWPEFDVPADWNVVLIDEFTGTEINLSQDESYKFSLIPDHNKSNIGMVREYSINSLMPEVQRNKSPESARFMLSISKGEINDVDLPNQFTLHQNYPNPFNPTTVISYELPQTVDVTLEVYDMLGRQISTLVDGRVNAGAHQVTFDASNLSSGVYIYRLSAGEQMFTRKLTVLK